MLPGNSHDISQFIFLRYAEAQEIANDLLRLDNMNADAIYVRGLCLYYEDSVDKAFTHFQHVLRLAPDHQKAKDVYKVRGEKCFVISEYFLTCGCAFVFTESTDAQAD